MTSRHFAPAEVLALFRPHDLTLANFLAARIESDPHHESLWAGDTSWSRVQVMGAAKRLAATLQAKGVQKGDRVVVVARNSPWHVFALIACGLTGAVFVPVNPQFTVAELAYVMGHSRPALVIAGSSEQDLAASALAEAGHRADILLTATPLASAMPAAVDVAPEDPLLMIYTSGTTGFPKGALHSHQSFILAGEAFIGRMHLQPHERMLLILPMFHINALFYSVAGAMAAAGVLMIEERFSASKFWDVAVRTGATQVNMIEAVVSILLSRPEAEYRPEHRIRKAYGIRQAMVSRVQARFSITDAIGGYGMTEIPGVISTPYGEEAQVGAMGKLCTHPDPDRPWAECRIVDDAGQDLPLGETGELWVKTPVRMIGYFNDPEQTADSFAGEWFKTGDLVRRGEDGTFFFVARKKDIIRVRGENISGAELDRIALGHPDVMLAAAIGVPSPMGDEDIFLALTLRPDARLTAADIRAWLGSRLAAIKRPRYVHFVDDLPLTPTHKVQKLAYKKHVLENGLWRGLQAAE